ncbi:hypothetical protein EDC04DRAFT_2759102 [Pisolithus marmoratus]|nr:hypothetical protein EDC04DRAFT_2759102 [Pisolithus marmoratus]
MYWQFDATPQPCAGSPASASTQAGSTVPPRTANNSAVQNQSQFDYGPSQLHPRDRVPSEDDQAPQHYRGPATSTPSIARALVPPPTASNATVQNQNWNHLDDHPSQLPLCGQLSSEDNQVPQHDLGPSPGGPTLYPATVSLPTSSHARNQYPNQFGNYPPQHRSGSSTGTIGLPLVTANNVAVQNRNQFGDYPSQLHLYGQISSEDNPTLQFYVGPQTRYAVSLLVRYLSLADMEVAHTL